MKMSLYNYIDVVTCGKMFTLFHALLNVSIHKWERTVLYIHAHFMSAYKSSSVSSNTYSPAYEYNAMHWYLLDQPCRLQMLNTTCITGKAPIFKALHVYFISVSKNVQCTFWELLYSCICPYMQLKMCTRTNKAGSTNEILSVCRDC